MIFIYCPFCGKKNKKNSEYCSECGKNIVKNPSRTDFNKKVLLVVPVIVVIFASIILMNYYQENDIRKENDNIRSQITNNEPSGQQETGRINETIFGITENNQDDTEPELNITYVDPDQNFLVIKYMGASEISPEAIDVYINGEPQTCIWDTEFNLHRYSYARCTKAESGIPISCPSTVTVTSPSGFVVTYSVCETCCDSSSSQEQFIPGPPSEASGAIIIKSMNTELKQDSMLETVIEIRNSGSSDQTFIINYSILTVSPGAPNVKIIESIERVNVYAGRVSNVTYTYRIPANLGYGTYRFFARLKSTTGNPLSYQTQIFSVVQ